MLWGAGTVDGTDSSRMSDFEAMNWESALFLGFEEPDCTASGAHVSMLAPVRRVLLSVRSLTDGVHPAAGIWHILIAPHGAAGSLLSSPSMCHQAAETWLIPFSQQISRQWETTKLHINKNSADGIHADLDHYWNTYGKPMWITEVSSFETLLPGANEGCRVFSSPIPE